MELHFSLAYWWLGRLSPLYQACIVQSSCISYRLPRSCRLASDPHYSLTIPQTSTVGSYRPGKAGSVLHLSSARSRWFSNLISWRPEQLRLSLKPHNWPWAHVFERGVRQGAPLPSFYFALSTLAHDVSSLTVAASCAVWSTPAPQASGPWFHAQPVEKDRWSYRHFH